MPTLRPMVVELPWDADVQRSPVISDEAAFSYEEDRLDQWIPVGILGGMVIGSALLVLLVNPQGNGTNIPGPFFVSIGILEMFFGVFLVYVVYPPAIWAVSVGSVLTVVAGVVLAFEGVRLAMLLGAVFLVVGAVLAAVGLLNAVRAWRVIARGS